MKKIFSSIEKRILAFLNKYPSIVKSGLKIYKNTNFIIFSWTVLFFIMFIENNFEYCIYNNLHLINIYYVNIGFSLILLVQIVLFILAFSVERYKFDNKQPTELETASRIDNDNKIIILPLFMLLMFTSVKIYIFFCKSDFSDYLTNLSMIPIILIFIYSLWLWNKYKSKSEQATNISIILISILPIFFICYWDTILPYIQEMMHLSECISKKILTTK